MAASTIANIHFDNTLGVLNIGNTLNASLYGVATIQVYMYFQRYNRDHLALKLMVFSMWIANTAAMGLYLDTVYFYGVTNFLSPEALMAPPRALVSEFLLGLLCDCTITGIYAFRVWKVTDTHAHIAVGVIVIMGLIQLSTGIGFAAIIKPGATYSDVSRYSYFWYLTFGSALGADLVITVLLCKTLYKRRTGIRRTDSLLNVIILYTVNTCAFTSLMRVASILAYALSQGTFVFVMVSSLLPRVIFSSLLALLNSRQVKTERQNDGLVSIHLSNLHSANSQTVGRPENIEGVGAETVSEQTYDSTVKHGLADQV